MRRFPKMERKARTPTERSSRQSVRCEGPCLLASAAPTTSSIHAPEQDHQSRSVYLNVPTTRCASGRRRPILAGDGGSFDFLGTGTGICERLHRAVRRNRRIESRLMPAGSNVHVHFLRELDNGSHDDHSSSVKRWLANRRRNLCIALNSDDNGVPVVRGCRVDVTHLWLGGPDGFQVNPPPNTAISDSTFSDSRGMSPSPPAQSR